MPMPTPTIALPHETVSDLQLMGMADHKAGEPRREPEVHPAWPTTKHWSHGGLQQSDRLLMQARRATKRLESPPR